jgi:hypothetical protein
MDDTPGRNDNFSKIIKTWQVDNLIGKIMLIVETMGLEKRQEESAKSLIKQEIWKEFNEGIYISGAMQEANYKANEKEGFVNLTQ